MNISLLNRRYTLPDIVHTVRLSLHSSPFTERFHMINLKTLASNTLLAGMVVTGSFLSAAALAQNWPDKPVTFIVPFPPRGIHSVFVNGVAVWENGRSTGWRPGRVLTHKQGT